MIEPDALRPRVNRRRFLQSGVAVGATPFLPAAGAAPPAAAVQPAGPAAPTGADVGSLFPFIQRQAVSGQFPLSFLNSRFGSLADWKPTARAKLLDLLHYAPAPCDPAAEATARVDCGDYVREHCSLRRTDNIHSFRNRHAVAPSSPSQTARPIPVRRHRPAGLSRLGNYRRRENGAGSMTQRKSRPIAAP